MKSTDNPESTPTFAGEIFDVVVPYTNSVADVSDSADIFDEDGTRIEGAQVPGYPQLLYMPFGYDNELPFHIMREIGSDEVMSQNLFFNILTAYGSGLQYVDRETKAPTEDPEIQRFMLMNSMR